MSAPETAHPGGLGLPDENRGPDILIATTIVTAFALITVVARLYVRIALIRNVGLDDYSMLLTMALSLAGWIIIIPEVQYGAGRHYVYLKESSIPKGLHLNFATQAIYLWAIGLVKVSIGLFLMRFAPRKGYKIFILVVIVAMALYTTICFFTLIFQCHDIRTIWDENVVSKCFTPRQLLELSYTNTGLNILTDLIFAFLPAIMLRNLQINRRQKASLICILGLGVFACAAAFVKLSILPHYGLTGDFLWDSADLTIWVVVECNSGIIAGSLPTLKPLFKRILSTYASRSKSRQYIYGTGQSNSQSHKLRSLAKSSRASRSRPSTVPGISIDTGTGTDTTGTGTTPTGTMMMGYDTITDDEEDEEYRYQKGLATATTTTIVASDVGNINNNSNCTNNNRTGHGNSNENDLSSTRNNSNNNNDHQFQFDNTSESEQSMLSSAARPGVGIVCTTTTEVRISDVDLSSNDHRSAGVAGLWNGVPRGYHVEDRV